MNARGAPDRSHSQRHFKFTDQFAVLSFGPGAQAGVLSGTCRVRMRAGFHRAPVVARGKHHRIHAVHDAFIVSCSAVRIGSSESPGFNDPVAHFLAGKFVSCQCFKRDRAGGFCQPAVRQV